ncbi:MAG: hypothetical protein ACRD3F_12405 [Acidobacteriaceae bacterium]
MSNPVPICTHIKNDGIRCGSPAEGGTEFCYHHSAVKTALGKVPAGRRGSNGTFAPIPFLFVEDRASLQINYSLLLTAFNNHELDLRTFRLMMSLLKAMGANLGKTGSLVDRAQGSERRAQEDRNQRPGNGDQEGAVGESLVALSAAAEKRGKAAGVGAFSFAPDYGFLPSVVSAVTVKPWEVGASDPVREMARQAARVRW